MLGSGVDGVSGRELMMFIGGAVKVSEGARASQGSSDSIFIVLIFFFLLSSFNFFLGRDRSKSAGSKKKKRERNIKRVSWNQQQQKKTGLRFINKSKIKKSLLTHSPLPTKICSWEYVSKMDIGGHQVWMVLSKSIISEKLYKLRLNYICVLFLTGCRFLFSRWFCSMTFKSCSPSSILSVKEKKCL